MSDDDRRCGNCCNWRADHDGETYALCELVNQVRPAHGGTACPSHNVDVAKLRAEVERLRGCMKRAGLFAFMRAGTPGEIADHLSAVAKLHVQYEQWLKNAVVQLRDSLESLVDLCDHAARDAWKNGVTDPSGMLDEGESRAAELYERARCMVVEFSKFSSPSPADAKEQGGDA